MRTLLALWCTSLHAVVQFDDELADDGARYIAHFAAVAVDFVDTRSSLVMLVCGKLSSGHVLCCRCPVNNQRYKVDEEHEHGDGLGILRWKKSEVICHQPRHLQRKASKRKRKLDWECPRSSYDDAN